MGLESRSRDELNVNGVRQGDEPALTLHQRLIGAIALHLQRAGKVNELSPDLAVLSRRRIDVDHRRRRRPAPRSIIHRMGPEPAGSSVLQSLLQNRQRRCPRP
jgi:hypothetical protein